MKRWTCRRHPGHFVTPCRQKLDYHTGCSKCLNDRNRSPEVRKIRAEKFDRLKYTKDFIACIHHPERLAQRSLYVSMARRKCCSCQGRLVSGETRIGVIRAIRRWQYNKMMTQRKFYGRKGRMNAMQVFERSTGFNLELAGFSRKEINGKNI